MKLDYDRAWQETLQLIQANRSLLAIIAGVFFFVPYAIFAMLVPDYSQFDMTDPAAMDAMSAVMMAFYRDNWWMLLIMAILQAIGLMGMLALLRHRGKPTVGQGLGQGVAMLLPYLAATFLQSVLLVAVLFVLLMVAGLAASAAVWVLLGLVGIAAFVFMATRFSLLAPVMAIEGTRNPLRAMARSWHLVKGNTLRAAGFYALLVIAYIAISAIISLATNLVLALFSAEIARFGGALVSAGLNAALVVVMAGVLAAIHGQLARLSGRSSAE